MRKILSIGVVLGANLVGLAQTEMPKPAYDFALPREERIKLAESAAPSESPVMPPFIYWSRLATQKFAKAQTVSLASWIGKLR
jgi:hypothetical protein